jgi:hypothetical protein
MRVAVCKGKGKSYPCAFNWAPCREDVLGEWRYSSTHSLTSALDGGEWSASRPGRFTPWERIRGTHWIRGWVGPRAVLDAAVKRKFYSPELENRAFAVRATEWSVLPWMSSMQMFRSSLKTGRCGRHWQAQSFLSATPAVPLLLLVHMSLEQVEPKGQEAHTSNEGYIPWFARAYGSWDAAKWSLRDMYSGTTARSSSYHHHQLYGLDPTGQFQLLNLVRPSLHWPFLVDGTVRPV